MKNLTLKEYFRWEHFNDGLGVAECVHCSVVESLRGELFLHGVLPRHAAQSLHL